MKKPIISLCIILLILFIAGGFVAVFQGLEVIGQIFIHIFPLFKPAFEQAIEDYLTSAYFIVGVIIFILSTVFGIVLTVKERKALYAIIAGIVDIISLVSIFSNLSCCG